MAYSKITDARYKEEKDVVKRLSNFKTDFAFSDKVSLTILSDAIDDMEAKRLEKNATLAQAELETIAYAAAVAKVEEIKAAMRGYIVLTKDKNCDEYVILGGARQSEVLALQQQTREENKKAAEEKKKADGGKEASN